jgi:glyoxylase-like metal-dependent hydrolase (beta-lactamase superfamily II)
MGAGLTYERGLQEVADGVFAYLQPDGGWGWSNAGLVAGDEDSLLIDTLFDLDLTRAMLEAMSGITDSRPVTTLVNTHANGDHCFGNQLVSGAQVITSAASAAEMAELPPAMLAAMMSADFGETTNAYLQEAFGAFTFSGIEAPAPTQTFSGRLHLDQPGRPADLIEVGPAHTAGDVLVHLPATGVIFTGDILFIGGTPIVWAGPVSNWIRACDTILELDCSVIVPGHGPLTDRSGVEAVASYLNYVHAEATARFQAGMRADEAARDIELGSYADWLDWERVAINVDTVYRELDPSRPPPDVMDLFRQMAELKLHK